MLRRLLTAVAIVLGGFVILPQTASAHHPLVSGTAYCNDDGTWSIDWVVAPWEHQPNLKWKITSPSNVYSPAGLQTALGSSRFTRTEVRPADDLWEQETVTAKWYEFDGDFRAEGTRTSAKVYKPGPCPVTTTTTTTTTTSTTSTTSTTTTTTSTTSTTTTTTLPCAWDPNLPPDDPGCFEPCEWNPQLPADSPDCYEPCQWNPQLPADSPDCYEPCEYDSSLPADDPNCQPPCEWNDELLANDPLCFPPCEWNPDISAESDECLPPDITVEALCVELDTSGELDTYWYEIFNPEDEAILVTWDGGSVSVPAGDSRVVAGDVNGLAISVDGTVVDTADPLDTSTTDITLNDDICQIDVEVAKNVQGPAPGADTLYTIKISRTVLSGESDVEFVETVTFQLADDESKVVPLPSTYNPEGIEYVVEEVEDGGATGTAITPDTFIVNGHLGETISVEIVNTFAAVEIEKTVSDSVIFNGDELTYTLEVTNTGAVTLDPVVVDDLLPPQVSYAAYAIEGDAGSCTLTDSNKPQLVTCTFSEALEPGESAPTITLLVDVDDVEPGDDVVNVARVRGTYSQVTELPQRQLSERLVEFAGVLTCEPTENEVCDMSPRANTTGGTVTTTSVAVQGPTTTLTGSSGATTTLVQELPRTGGDGVRGLLSIGTLLVLSGLGIAVATRRRQTA